MTEVLNDKALAQLRTAGLVLPRSAQPGRYWAPGTAEEQHLLNEARRLDRVRLVLLEHVGVLRQQSGRIPRAEALAAAARTAERLRDCPLSPAQLSIVAAAAAGETPEETASRLCLSYDTVRSHRRRLLSRLEARSITHAVALCVAAGWVTVGQVTGGVTP